MSKPTCTKSAYAEKLKDPRWHARREEIFTRKGRLCTDCEATPDDVGALQVHHLNYIRGREPWDYEDDYLIPLCRSCHENRQSIEDETKQEIALLFGKMSVWQVYEMGKTARRLRAEHRPDVALAVREDLADIGF